MTTKHDDDIQRALESLDGIKRAEAPHFLYAKVKAKIAARTTPNRQGVLSIFAQPAVSLALLVVMAVLNIYMLTKLNIENTKTSIQPDKAAEAFAKAYSLVIYSAYDKTR